MSFALHLFQGINLVNAVDMIRVDTLIDMAEIGPNHAPTPTQRILPHSHADEIWGAGNDPRPHSCFECVRVWEIKKFGS